MTNLIILCLLCFVGGMFITAGIWCGKHPEDFYSVEEVDPDPEVELEEIDHAI